MVVSALVGGNVAEELCLVADDGLCEGREGRIAQEPRRQRELRDDGFSPDIDRI